jgi:hypothetical protein
MGRQATVSTDPRNPDRTNEPREINATRGDDDGAALRQAAARVGEVLGGRFALQHEIGRGGAGAVFAAFDARVGQRVALKVLHGGLGDPNQLERLRREVRASRPAHPNAVAVFDLFDDGLRRFLTMELVDGRSLKQELTEHGPLSVERTIDVGRQLAAALADLHGKGLVHRDVKPGNVLVTSTGVVKLCDLGLVRSIDRGMTITETEMVVGTPAYMAPEQALAGDRTAASDAYALGLTLFECLAGQVPMQADTAVATLMLRQRSGAPRVRSLRPDSPLWLDRLLRWMLEPAPADRPTTAEVELALSRRRLSRRLRPRPRHLVAAALAGIVLAAAAVGLHAVGRRPAATVEAVGSDVVGRDDRGRELWRVPVDRPDLDLSRVDLDGDGADEVLVAGHRTRTGRELPGELETSEIVILDIAGRVNTRLEPERLIGEWGFHYRLEVNPTLSVLDVDRDGVLEVIANCRQRRYFPTVLLVYWSRWDLWEEVVRHPGSIYGVFPAPPDAPPGLRFVGINNRLAMSMVLGVVELVPPGERRQELSRHESSFDAPPFSGLGRNNRAAWVDYALFRFQQSTSGSSLVSLEEAENGGWEVGIFGGTARLDRFLNPADGPNAGRDLRGERVELFNHLLLVKPGFTSFSAEGVEGVRAAVARSCGGLLADPVYEVVVLDSLACASAQAGDVDGAVAILRPACARLRNDELSFLLANIEALRGDLVSSGRRLRRLMDVGETQRAFFDAPKLAIRIGAEGRDPEMVSSSVSYLQGRSLIDSPRVDLSSTLWAGVRLWWDEASEADTRVESVDYVEEGDAVACLTRWRRGASLAGDVDAMRRFVELNPDAAGIGRAALAAALVGAGRPADAVAECDASVALIEDWAKASFAERQNLELVRAIRTVALLASGDRALARREAERLATELSSNLLPGILVREVLESYPD